MSYASGDFRSARGSSAAETVTGGQDIPTQSIHAGNSADAANTANGGGSTTTTPTAAAARVAKATKIAKAKVSNHKSKANTEQDYMEADEIDLGDLIDEAMNNNQLEDQEYDDDDRADARMPNVRYRFLVDVMVDASNSIATSSNYISTTCRPERT